MYGEMACTYHVVTGIEYMRSSSSPCAFIFLWNFLNEIFSLFVLSFSSRATSSYEFHHSILFSIIIDSHSVRSNNLCRSALNVERPYRST